MGVRVSRLVDRIREEKGPFFVARICLRVNCRIDDKAPDSPEAERAIVDACRELGFHLGAVEFGASPSRQ
jgi:hypothetical protein